MLYDTVDAWNLWMSPWSALAGSTSQALTNPGSPLSVLPFAHQVAAAPEMFHRISKAYGKPEFGITQVQRGEHLVRVSESVRTQTPFCSLLEFERSSTDPSVNRDLGRDPIVLVVAPMSGHHATLLRDTVRTMLPHHRVFITDWIDARRVSVARGHFDLDTYVYILEEFLTHLGPDRVHVMGVCQPVVPVMGAVSRLATRGGPSPRSMILMGGPVDARQSPTSVNNLASTKPYEWFESNLVHRVPLGYPGTGRSVYPGFLQHMGFIAMNPDRHAKSHWEFFQDLLAGSDDAQAHRDFYDEYNAVMDMPAEFYLQTIRSVFQEFELARGTWEVSGELVMPQDITRTALLTIEGERDDISGQGQTRAAHGLLTGLSSSMRHHLLAKGAGHYGLFSGRRWREKIYPQVREFIRKSAGD